MNTPDTTQQTTTITIRVPFSFAGVLARRAAQQQRTRSELLREMIHAALEDWPSTEQQIRSIRHDLVELRGEVGEMLRKRIGRGD